MGGGGGDSSRNLKKRGFSALTRQRHFEKHGNEYGAVSPAAYESLAMRFRDRPVNADIRQFTSSSGLRFKYDSKSNDLLIYRDNGQIITMFKPRGGLDYWERQVDKYGHEY